MKTISNRQSNSQSRDSLAEMKSVLLETQDKLRNSMEIHRGKAAESSRLAESWLTRFYTARKALMDTEIEMAIEALTVLADQAKQYALAYAKVQEDETSKFNALQANYIKMEATVTRLRLAEKSKALNGQLQRISGSIDIPAVASSYDEINPRDVSLMIHTAQALIELNTGKDF